MGLFYPDRAVGCRLCVRINQLNARVEHISGRLNQPLSSGRRQKHAVMVTPFARCHSFRGAGALAVCSANVVISIVSTCLYYKELWALRAAPAFAVQLGCLLQATQFKRLR